MAAIAPIRIPIIIERDQRIPDAIRDWTPRSRLGLSILRSLPYLPDDLALELIERARSVAIMESELRAKVIRGLGLFAKGLIPREELVIEDHGVVSRKVVTNAGVGFIVDAFQNSAELENLRYHALGTGTNAEAVGDTALQTELTTEYTGNQRAQGTITESAANIFQTVGTNTLDSGTPAITEHGILSQQATGGGTLLDRSQFAAINLNGGNGDGLQTDYRLTLTAGS
jgi:hypothetical protein